MIKNKYEESKFNFYQKDEYLCDFEVEEDFLNKTPKAQNKKEKMNKCDCNQTNFQYTKRQYKQRSKKRQRLEEDRDHTNIINQVLLSRKH